MVKNIFNMMKHSGLLVVIGLLVATSCRRSDSSVQTFVDTRKTATATETAPAEREDNVTDILIQRTPKGMPDKILTRTGYTTSYNHETRCPNWVAWTLTRDHSRGSQLRENERFEEDPDVKTPRATFQDFYSSRYDRGHMCPAGDNKWSRQAMTESFLLTNICPQNHGLNKDDWNDLEIQCRSWARQFGEVTIVCGPIFDAEAQPRTIGKNKVRVPDRFFKVVYCAEPSPRALAFIFHNNGQPQPWQQQLTTVDSVEMLTGINFFPALPNAIENRIEAEALLKDW